MPLIRVFGISCGMCVQGGRVRAALTRLILCTGMDKYAAAVDMYKKGLKLDPDNQQALFVLFVCPPCAPPLSLSPCLHACSSPPPLPVCQASTCACEPLPPLPLLFARADAHKHACKGHKHACMKGTKAFMHPCKGCKHACMRERARRNVTEAIETGASISPHCTLVGARADEGRAARCGGAMGNGWGRHKGVGQGAEGARWGARTHGEDEAARARGAGAR